MYAGLDAEPRNQRPYPWILVGRVVTDVDAMSYSFFVTMNGVYLCAYCGAKTRQRPVLRDSESAYPPCCLSCMNRDLELWQPEPVTAGIAAMISAQCDDRSRATAGIQTAYLMIAKERGWDACNSFNGGVS
jgi:endogenous inhibitor of DNA gyrase (YacG/DUF329 family)